MIGDVIVPDSRHLGEIAMVVQNFPGRQQIGGRLVKLRSIQKLADGTTRFVCELLDDSSPHGDRYVMNPALDARFLELCNISDSMLPSGNWHCYNHGMHKDPEGRSKWQLPTPPKFKTQAEADEWMAQHEERVRVRTAINELREEYVDQYGIKHCPPAGAFDPEVTPIWPDADLPF